jgi:DNA sulfur modification protein DndD
MLFRELVLENFGSYLGKNVINFLPETEEESQPIILIGGMNGGGKTTIMDAMRLALYGARAQCSTRGSLSYGDFLNQCINRQTGLGDKTRIELAFQVTEDSQPINLRVVRYWERNPKDGKDTLGILVNDEWPDKALVNTWDEYIENLLPLGISNLFLFDGEQVKELAEQETPPASVCEAIQSLLGLELAERLAADLDVLVARKRRELASERQLTAIEEIEAELEGEQAELINREAELEQIKTKLETAIAQEQQAFDKFVHEGGKIAAQGQQLKQQLQVVSQQKEQQEKGMRELAAGILPLALILPLLTEVKEIAAIELRDQQRQVSLDLLIDRDRKLIEYLESQAIISEKIAAIQAFLDKENQRLAQAMQPEQSIYLNATPEVLSQLEGILKYDLDRDRGKLKELQNQLNKLNTELDFLDRQIAEAASPEEYERLKQQEKIARDRVNKLTADRTVTQQKIQELSRQIDKTKKELTEYTETNIKLLDDRHLIDAIAKVKETLQVFKEQLTLRKINKLENEVTECFRYLLHKSELVHRVVIDSNTFTLALYDREGKLLPKHRLSAGEKQLLAISLLWGLARVSGRQLPVAIDTPLGRLDSSHRINLINRYFPAASEQVILLSTDTEIGTNEAQELRAQGAIAREYLLVHDAAKQCTEVKLGYFERG